MLLLFFGTQGTQPAAGVINASVLVQDLWPPLNAISAADAVFWTEGEMYQWFNEAGRRLSGRVGVYVVHDTSLSSLSTVRVYALPAAHNGTIQADLAGLVLKPRTVQEEEALDAAWLTTSGAPVAFLQDDAGGVTEISLAPAPDVASAGQTIGLLMRSSLADVSAVGGFLIASPALSEYFTFYVLGEARAKEGRAQMPEISAWFRALCGQLEKVVSGYLGEAA